jgi:serine phosphatase RsbU (regulator of sigma subunit)
VAANAESVVINDVENDTRYRCIEALDETQSEMAVPLCLDDEIVGVLDVQSIELNAFGPDDLFILETLADQIAIAIQEARLFKAEQEQAWLSTALLQVAEASSRLSDMDDVLTTIVRLTPILAGVDRCAILLWDDDGQSFRPAQTHGLEPAQRARFEGTVFHRGEVAALDQLHKSPAPMLIDLSLEDSIEGSLLPPDMVQAYNIREMVLFPLLARGEMLGAMMVDYAGRPRSFTSRVIEMLTGIANQSALVIQNARLFQAQQEEAYVSMALLMVAEAVSRSADLGEAMASVARITPMLVGVEACAFFLKAGDSTTFLPFEQYGLKRRDLPAFWAQRLSDGDPIASALLDGDPSYRLDDAQEGPEAARILSEGALTALPLISKGALLGIMTVDLREEAGRPTDRWMNILTGIADQAAVAVENDQLLKEAAEQERLKKELEVAHSIQSSFLPEGPPEVPGWEIAAIWQSAREVGGDFYDFIHVADRPGSVAADGQRLGVVIADVADKGVPAALFMALSRTLMRTMAISGRRPREAVTEANRMIQADARSSLFVTLFYLIIEADSGAMSYVSAGHMPPLLVRGADGATEELRTGGMAMGVLPDVDFEERSAEMEPGDVLILYTDGVTDAANLSDEGFERERLAEVARTHRAMPADQLAETINERVAAFVGDAPQFDDFTLLVLKRTG